MGEIVLSQIMLREEGANEGFRHAQVEELKHFEYVDANWCARISVVEIGKSEMIEMTINCRVSQLRWPLKTISPIGQNKFTYENSLYYGDYVVWTQGQDCMRLKFLDESHFGPDRITSDFFFCSSSSIFLALCRAHLSSHLFYRAYMYRCDVCLCFG